MPSFLSRQGSNRLQRARKTDDEGVTITTTTGTTKGVGGPGGGATTAGRQSGEISEPRRSFASFTRKNSTSGNNPKPLQRSESWKRRFNLSILTRGKNRTSTEQQQEQQDQKEKQEQQGTVSSRIGHVRHQSTGSAKVGEFGARSKDGAPLHLRQQQQTSALGAVVAQPKSKLSKPRPSTLSSSPSRLPVLARPSTKPPSHLALQSKSTLLPPVNASAPVSLSLGLSPQQPQPQQQRQHREQEQKLEQEQEQHQQQEGLDGMAATTSTTTTTTMTSLMQEPKRTFSLTLTVDELPHSRPPHAHQQQQQHHQQQTSSPPPQTQRSNYYHPSSASPPPHATGKVSNQSSMFNARKPSPLVLSPSSITLNTKKQTSNALIRPAPIELSKPVAPQSPAELSESIGAPLPYYITPSQTPTLPDRLSGNNNPILIPTGMHPGPATPPLTESGSTSKLTIVTDPSDTQIVPWRGTSPHDAASEDRTFNGPPTPASSASSQTNPGKRVNFAEQLELDTTPTSSIRSVRSNPGNVYTNPPPQNRFNNYRPPPPHPLSGPRNSGPRQLPLRGPPHGKMPFKSPPDRPPSPIYTNPPNMKTHLWAPLQPTQINCVAGHTFVPFRNKQHSILCTVCRSMEFEGRGEPVKRSFYCSWCAVRMCAGCKEELMEECGGKLTELWERTEEKRASNMVKVKEGKMKMVKRGDVYPTSQTPTGSNGESFEPRGGTSIAQGDAPSRAPQEVLFTATEGFPFPEQRPSPPPQRQLQPQQSKGLLPQSRTTGPEQSRTPQPQQSSIPRLRPQTSQLEQPKSPQPQQPRGPQTNIPRLQSRTPQPERSRTPRSQEPRTQQPQQPRSPRSSVDKRPPDRKLVPQQSRSATQLTQSSEKQGQYRSIPRDTNRSPPLRLPAHPNMSASPPPIPQLTPAETERYRLIPVPSHQKPPSSGTVVLVGEKQKEPSIGTPSLKGSLKKKKGWFRGFGKRKKEDV